MKKIMFTTGGIIIVIGILFGITLIIGKSEYNKKVNVLEKELTAKLKKIEEKNTQNKNKMLDELSALSKEIEEISNNEEKLREEVRNMSFVGIGDSVFEDALSEIKALLPNGYYDAKISRPLVTGNEILRNLKNQGKLTDIILLGLANNGYYSESRCKDLMDIVGDRTVYWINSVGPDDPSYNGKFKEFAKNYSNIIIVDWEERSKGHSEYFYKDGTHLKPAGLKAYAEMIYDYLYDGYKQSLTSKVEKKKEELEEANRQKLAFYGNDLLISTSDEIYTKYDNSVLNAKRKYNFKELYQDLKEKKESNQLEYNIVLMFDEKANISVKEYESIIELCTDRNIYIVNLRNNNVSFDSDRVKVINFYEAINNNKDYLEFDNKHLSEKGINALVEELERNI